MNAYYKIQARTQGTFEVEEFSDRGFVPLSGPQWIQGEGLMGEQESTPPEANRFIDFTHLQCS